MLYISRCRRLELAEEYFRINNSWDENKHPRDEKGRFSHSNVQKNKSFGKYGYLDQIDKMIDLDISEPEFMQVVSEINTLYYGRFKKENCIEYYASDFIYYAENKGFNNYIFSDKMVNDDSKKDWG